MQQTQQTNNIFRHESTYKQLEAKTNQTSALPGNHNGHHNTELRTYRHIIGQNVRHHYTQQKQHTNNIQTRVILQTTGEKDEPNIVFMGTSQLGTRNIKTHNRTNRTPLSATKTMFTINKNLATTAKRRGTGY